MAIQQSIEEQIETVKRITIQVQDDTENRSKEKAQPKNFTEAYSQLFAIFITTVSDYLGDNMRPLGGQFKEKLRRLQDTTTILDTAQNSPATFVAPLPNINNFNTLLLKLQNTKKEPITNGLMQEYIQAFNQLTLAIETRRQIIHKSSVAYSRNDKAAKEKDIPSSLIETLKSLMPRGLAR